MSYAEKSIDTLVEEAKRDNDIRSYLLRRLREEQILPRQPTPSIALSGRLSIYEPDLDAPASSAVTTHPSQVEPPLLPILLRLGSSRITLDEKSRDWRDLQSRARVIALRLGTISLHKRNLYSSTERDQLVLRIAKVGQALASTASGASATSPPVCTILGGNDETDKVLKSAMVRPDSSSSVSPIEQYLDLDSSTLEELNLCSLLAKIINLRYTDLRKSLLPPGHLEQSMLIHSKVLLINGTYRAPVPGVADPATWLIGDSAALESLDVIWTVWANRKTSKEGGGLDWGLMSVHTNDKVTYVYAEDTWDGTDDLMEALELIVDPETWNFIKRPLSIGTPPKLPSVLLAFETAVLGRMNADEPLSTSTISTLASSKSDVHEKRTAALQVAMVLDELDSASFLWKTATSGNLVSFRPDAVVYTA